MRQPLVVPATSERREKWAMAPSWVRLMKQPIVVLNRLRLVVRPPLLVKPFDYELYTRESPGKRVFKRADRPTSFWKGRFGM